MLTPATYTPWEIATRIGKPRRVVVVVVEQPSRRSVETFYGPEMKTKHRLHIYLKTNTNMKMMNSSSLQYRSPRQYRKNETTTDNHIWLHTPFVAPIVS